MAREIKFRVWDSQFNHMVKDPGHLRLNLANGHVHGRMSGGNVPSWVLMQYTGLKDKNGVDIYEGDIVKSAGYETTRKGVVYFQSTRLSWSVKHSAYANQDLFVYSRPDFSVEVIGNVHQNQELLDSGK